MIERLKRLTLAAMAAGMCLMAAAQKTNPVERVVKFGDDLPQEKVYLHLDNSCYFLGDTIYYKAYVTRSDNNKASDMSRLLYVELLTPDGFLVQRSQVPVSQEGNGFGTFALTDSLYAGYYEVRAYTRWQLNFGVTEREHNNVLHDYFYSKTMREDFFRDYEKLYSRVIPVYDRPREEGNFRDRSMTARPLRKTMKTEKPDLDIDISFYPEGGQMVVGAPARVAFEASNAMGQHIAMRGTALTPSGDSIHFATSFRGKGSISIPKVEAGTYKVFTVYGNHQQQFKLPKAEHKGVAIQMTTDSTHVTATIQTVGLEPGVELFEMVQCGGKTRVLEQLRLDAQGQARLSWPQPLLTTGVNTLIITDRDGHVYADRLFFVNNHEYDKSRLKVTGQKDEYEPFEAVSLDFQMEGTTEPAEFSLAVRDKATGDPSFDDSSILTEMLLGSEVRGFIESPSYFFEGRDQQRRDDLDLLLRVQGWRRYSWQDMAGQSEFKFRYLPERFQTLEGEVCQMVTNPYLEEGDDKNVVHDRLESKGLEYFTTKRMVHKVGDNGLSVTEEVTDTNFVFGKMTPVMTDKERDKEATVRAEFVLSDGTEVNDGLTQKGAFRLMMPQYFGEAVTFLRAYKDSLKDAKAFKNWSNEEQYPLYYVKQNLCFPLFTQPYSFYQTNSPEFITTEGKFGYSGSRLSDEHVMTTVVIGARKTKTSPVNYDKPALVLDAYDAYNYLTDRGISHGKMEMIDASDDSIAFLGFRLFCKRLAMGLLSGAMSPEVVREIDKVPYPEGDHSDHASLYGSSLVKLHLGFPLDKRFEKTKENPEFSRMNYSKNFRLQRMDKVYVYTDFSPRNEDDKRFSASNNKMLNITVSMYPDGMVRPSYRDRYFKLPGYSECTEFYNPDYSKKPLPEVKDYRRTLYWAPVVKTDEKGHAKVTFYNNSKKTQMEVSADGLTKSGLPVTYDPNVEKGTYAE